MSGPSALVGTGQILGLRNMLHGKLGHLADLVAGGVIVGSLAQWLPPVAAFFGLIYTLIRTYETDTVQSLLGCFRRKQK